MNVPYAIVEQFHMAVFYQKWFDSYCKVSLLMESRPPSVITKHLLIIKNTSSGLEKFGGGFSFFKVGCFMAIPPIN